MNNDDVEPAAKVYVTDWVVQRLFQMVTQNYSPAEFERLATSWSGAFSRPRPAFVTSQSLGEALDAEMASFLAGARGVRSVIP